MIGPVLGRHRLCREVDPPTREDYPCRSAEWSDCGPRGEFFLKWLEGKGLGMSITAEQRKEAVGTYRVHAKDSGSPDVQIALLTTRINELTGHLQTHKKDNASRRGLVLMVSKRNRLLKYLARTEPERYTSLIGRLGLRK